MSQLGRPIEVGPIPKTGAINLGAWLFRTGYILRKVGEGAGSSQEDG
jgi:hypothetical protein